MAHLLGGQAYHSRLFEQKVKGEERHGIHWDFADVVIAGIIGGILLPLSLARREQSIAVAQYPGSRATLP
jgi:hypothetical protein